MEFSAEQKEFLKEVFYVDLYNVTFVKVADGYAKTGDTIYWHWDQGLIDEDGAQEQKVPYPYTGNWGNILNYPHLYSKRKPEIIKKYTLDY